MPGTDLVGHAGVTFTTRIVARPRPLLDPSSAVAPYAHATPSPLPTRCLVLTWRISAVAPYALGDLWYSPTCTGPAICYALSGTETAYGGCSSAKERRGAKGSRAGGSQTDPNEIPGPVPLICLVVARRFIPTESDSPGYVWY
eukprot:1498572-Rhodomonas_salina.3